MTTTKTTATKKTTTPKDNLERSFSFNGMTLPDPDASMTTTHVRDFYAGTYPELNNADIKGPVASSGKNVYTFNVKTGPLG
jgi:PRTRC genetic system protein C